MELALAAVGGDEGVGASDDEGRHAVAREIRRERQRQRGHVAPPLQRGPGDVRGGFLLGRLLPGCLVSFLHDGLADGQQGGLARGGGFAPLHGIAAVELVGQQQQALQIGLHGGSRQAVAFTLQQLLPAEFGALHAAVRRGGVADAACGQQGAGHEKGCRSSPMEGAQGTHGKCLRHVCGQDLPACASAVISPESWPPSSITILP